MVDEDGHEGQYSDLHVVSIARTGVGLQKGGVDYVDRGEPDEGDDVCPELDRSFVGEKVWLLDVEEMNLVLLDEQIVEVFLRVVVLQLLAVSLVIVLYERVGKLREGPVSLVVVVGEHQEEQSRVDFQLFGDELVCGVKKSSAVVEVGLELRMQPEDPRVDQALCEHLYQQSLECVVVELLLY